MLEAMPLMIVSALVRALQPARWQMRNAAILTKIGLMLMRQATGTSSSDQQPELSGPKDNKGKQRSLFRIEKIIIERAPIRCLPGMDGKPETDQQ